LNIAIFNKKYRVRRFDEERVVKGYFTASHRDFTVSIHVHPSGSDTVQANPEGARRVKRLEAHGTVILRAADQETGQKGDLLFYHGAWYECISAVEHEDTILSHWNYVFVIVPNDAAGTIDTSTNSEEGEYDESEWS